MFRRILVANRGEVALESFGPAKIWPWKPSPYFSEADRNASYLHLPTSESASARLPLPTAIFQHPRIIAAAEMPTLTPFIPDTVSWPRTPISPRSFATATIELIGPSAESMKEYWATRFAPRNSPRPPTCQPPPTRTRSGPRSSTAVEVAAKIGLSGRHQGRRRREAGGASASPTNEATLRFMFQAGNRARRKFAFKDGRLYMEKCTRTSAT